MNIRTSVFRGVAILALGALGLTACENKTSTTPVVVPVAVVLTPTDVTLDVGGTATFVAVVQNSTNQSVTFASSNPAVATVNASTGAVVAVAPGSTTITATAAADATAKAAASVTVRQKVVNLTVAPTTATLNVGGTVQLGATVSGTGFTDHTVSYLSLSPTIASVNATGLVTAVAPGTAVIQVTATADANVKQNAVITVNTPPAVSIVINPTAASTSVGQTVQFVGTVSNSSNTTVTYTSSNTGVATINANGLASAVGAGTTTITATAAADPTKTASATLTVAAATPVVISVQPTAPGIQTGGTVILVPTITGTSNTAFTCVSAAPGVATTAINGTTCVVTGVAAGTAVITLTSAADNTKTATSVVTVTAAPAISISMTPSSASVVAGGSAVPFQVTVTNSSQGFTCSTNNTAVAGVTSNGTSCVATPVAAGTAVISATSVQDPTKVATATLTVTAAPPITLSVTPTSITNLGAGATTQILATVTGASDQTVVCTTSDAAIATTAAVVGGCNVTGVNAGNAVIRIAANANPSAVQTVPVTVLGASVAINSTTAAVPPATTVGNFTVTTNVSVPAGTADRLVIRLTPTGGGSAIDVTCQNFTSAGAATLVVCPINPGDYDAQTAGAQIIPNGTYTLQALLMKGTAIAASATLGQQVITANPNTTSFTTATGAVGVSFVNPDGPAQNSDPQGRLWNSGTINVVVTQQVFTGPSAATMDINYDVNCDGVADATVAGVTPNASGEFVASFPKSVDITGGTGSGNVSDLTSCVFVSNERASAAANNVAVTFTAGSQISTVFALDNGVPTLAAPTLPAAVVANNNFIGRGFTFNNANFGEVIGGNTFDVQADIAPAAACAGTVLADQCVNTVTVQYYANTTASYTAGGTTTAARNAAFAVAANLVTGAQAQNIAQLTSNSNNTQYTVVAVATDALGNKTIVAGPTFGVDLINPLIVTSTTPRTINPRTDGSATAGITVTVSDDPAGSGPDLARASITGYSVTTYNGNLAMETSCFTNAGVRSVAPASGICPTFDVALAPVGGGSTNGTATINLPGLADENLFYVSIAPVDNAGNAGTAVLKKYQQDETTPVITTTATTVAGNTISTTGDVVDNVELAWYDARYNFVGLGAAAGNAGSVNMDQVPFIGQTVVGAFDLPLSASVSGVTVTNTPRIRELDINTPFVAGTVNPNQFGLAANDLSNNYVFSGQALAAAGGDGVLGIRAGGTGFVLSRTPTTLCQTGTTPTCTSTANTSTTMTGTLETDPTVNTNPFVTVYFYIQNAGDDRILNNGDDYWQLVSTQSGNVTPQTGVNNRTFAVGSGAIALSVFSPQASAALPQTYALMAIGVDVDGDAIAAFNTITIQ